MLAASAQDVEFAHNVQLALSSCGFGRLLDPTLLDPTATDMEFPEYELDSEDEVDPDDLPDVCFDPVGPPLKPQDYAPAITDASDLPEGDCSICRDTLNVHERAQDEIPVKTDCGHAFHYSCLGTLINGLADFSNLCPNCRRPICDHRPRQLKEDDELNGVQALDLEEQAVVERFLLDRHRGVVMRD
ncbi:hypothetical protein J4E93_005692 [Alternaria ventricosa]|uniref:uncharacterized protein n=1 Tax=Alternaria ventricosa TaxID=1187951 RepID=UPI0020C4D29C|nr:uncharacterized protein J4E93_005692 [Alternaria ventricosa]KAI4644894.1 hypothetical protein J4E93_005692 [Alternaria ventricosa]